MFARSSAWPHACGARGKVFLRALFSVGPVCNVRTQTPSVHTYYVLFLGCCLHRPLIFPVDEDILFFHLSWWRVFVCLVGLLGCSLLLFSCLFYYSAHTNRFCVAPRELSVLCEMYFGINTCHVWILFYFSCAVSRVDFGAGTRHSCYALVLVLLCVVRSGSSFDVWILFSFCFNVSVTTF